MLDNSKISSVHRVPVASQAQAAQARAEPTLVNRDALDLFSERPNAFPTMPGPVIPGPSAPMPATVPKVLRPIDPAIKTAFAQAGVVTAPGSLAERAAVQITRVLRDALEGRPPADETPFPTIIAQAYGAAHEASVNAACLTHVAAVRQTLADTLVEECDITDAVAQRAAALADPFVTWGAEGWSFNLFNGAFVDAVWDVIGGRSPQTHPTFVALFATLQENARDPVSETILAPSEEQRSDLVDTIAGIMAARLALRR